jgi:hypothetical protein
VTINAADLPPDVRKKLGLANARKPRTTQRTGPHHAGSWTCHACGLTSTKWAPIERHAQETKHCRIDIDVTRSS